MDTLRIIAEIKVKPEFRDRLLPVLEELVKGSRAEAGNRQYDLSESIETAGHFFVEETWASKKALEEHNATPHFQAFVAATQGKTEILNIAMVKNIF